MSCTIWYSISRARYYWIFYAHYKIEAGRYSFITNNEVLKTTRLLGAGNENGFYFKEPFYRYVVTCRTVHTFLFCYPEIVFFNIHLQLFKGPCVLKTASEYRYFFSLSLLNKATSQLECSINAEEWEGSYSRNNM